MKNNSYILFAGKEFGARCLSFAIERGYAPNLVITNPEDRGEDLPYDQSVKKLCLKHNIDNISFKELVNSDPRKYIQPGAYDIGISAFCSRIIPASVIELFKVGITNTHFSLLPMYRGQFPTVYAIFNGDEETGVTVHWIDVQADIGDIIFQEKLAISPSDTGFSLFNKCLNTGLAIFKKQIELLQNEQNWPTARAQNFDPKIHLNQDKYLPNKGEIDWSWSGERIYNFLRACYHPAFPMPQFNIGKQQFRIIESN